MEIRLEDRRVATEEKNILNRGKHKWKLSTQKIPLGKIVMANTYTQIHLHVVFAVQNRVSLISGQWNDRLYQYISAILSNKGHKPLVINGMPDHVHLVFGMRPVEALADLMRDVKGDSSAWINSSKLVMGKFRWQDGYGAFTCSKSQLPSLIRHVHNQQLHHQKRSFAEEYKALLNKAEIDYDPRYLFQEIVN